MHVSKSKRPAARGPLAKTAMSRSSEFSYGMFDLNGEKLISKMEGALAIEEFKHPDFNGRVFSVWESEAISRHRPPSRSWIVTVHVVQGGVIVRKSFTFQCGLTLERIKVLSQLERAANKRVAAKKSIKARIDIL